MNLVKIQIWLKPHNMIAKVMLNQDSILDFPKVPHILSISHLKYQSWISVYTFEFQNGRVMTSPANQLAKWSSYDVTSLSACKWSCYDIIRNSTYK